MAKTYRKLKEVPIKIQTEAEFLQALLNGYLVDVPGFGKIECCERTGGRFLVNEAYYPLFFDELKKHLDKCKVYQVTLIETPWYLKAAPGNIVFCKTLQGEVVVVEVLSHGRFLPSVPIEMDELTPLNFKEAQHILCN